MMLKFTIAAATVLATASAVSDTVSIDASDSRVNYIGRFMDDTDNTKTFAWTASQIAIKFEGDQEVTVSWGKEDEEEEGGNVTWQAAILEALTDGQGGLGGVTLQAVTLA